MKTKIYFHRFFKSIFGKLKKKMKTTLEKFKKRNFCKRFFLIPRCFIKFLKNWEIIIKSWESFRTRKNKKKFKKMGNWSSSWYIIFLYCKYLYNYNIIIIFFRVFLLKTLIIWWKTRIYFHHFLSPFST